MQSSPINSTPKLPTADAPDLSIILVCWNNKEYLDQCLQSLYAVSLKCSFDVFVTDNGSVDGSQAMLREKYPDVRIIQNDGNLGLGKASNQGILASRGRYVLLLNNDTIVNAASLDAMVDFMDHHAEAGAVGGKLLNPDGSIQACFNSFPSLHEEFLIATRLGELFWKGYPSNIGDNRVRTINWLGSACLLLRRDTLDKVGLLDESYFIYGDEADLLFRFKRAGWEIYFLPDVTTIHFGGRSMDRWRRRKMVYRGKLLFFKKNYGAVRLFLLRILLAVLSLFKLVVWAIATVLPSSKDRAQKELDSNIEVIKLCWKLD